MWLKVFKSFLELSEITTTHKVSDAQKAFPSASRSRRATKSRDGRQLAEGKGGTCAKWKEWGHEEEKKKASSRIFNLLPWSQFATVGCLARQLAAALQRCGLETPTDF